MNRWVLGVDFGQRGDVTALAAVEIVPREPESVGGRTAKPWLDVRYLHRLPVGMSYPDQVAFVANLVDGTPELQYADVVVDATGVGVAVSDSLAEVMRRSFYRLSITAGAQATSEGVRLSVPKRDLVSRLAIAMQSRRLRVVQGLPDAAALYDELAQFGVQITDSGTDTYGARKGHDDLVLAVSYAVWFADRPSTWSTWMEYMRQQIGADLPTTARDWRGPVPR